MKSTNRHRSRRCNRALRAYGTGDNLEECLTDLLADVRHWCHQNGHDFLEIDDRAESAFKAEVLHAWETNS